MSRVIDIARAGHPFDVHVSIDLLVNRAIGSFWTKRTVQLDRVGITQRWPRFFGYSCADWSVPSMSIRKDWRAAARVKFFVVVKRLSKLLLRVGTSVDAEVSGGPKCQRHRLQRDVRRTLYRACVGSAAICRAHRMWSPWSNECFRLTSSCS